MRNIWTHPANAGSRLQSVQRFFRWQIYKRIYRRPAVVDFHGLKLLCHPDSTSASSVIYFNALPDYREMLFMQAYLQEGDNFLDIGANVGVYSLLAASCVGRTGSVDAFEPLALSAKRIDEQIRLNQLANIRVHRAAVADVNQTREFGYADTSAMMRLQRASEEADGGKANQQVPCIRLDDFDPTRNHAMGKMDIEGAEPLALQGAVNRLQAANPPVWLLELAGYSRFYGMDSAEMIAFLKAQGFDCGVYDPATRRIIYTDEPWQLNVQNVLAISRKHRATVEARIEARIEATRS